MSYIGHFPVESERYKTDLDGYSMIAGVSGDNITGVMLMTKSQENAAHSIVSFAYALDALNPEFSSDETAELAVELISNSTTNCIYRRGIVMYFRITNNIIVFGAEAATEEQYNQVIGKQ